MRNFNDMMQAMRQELDDPSGEYATHIQAAIFAALRFCAREPFYFNQTRDVVFDTVAGQGWYDSADHEQIGALAGLEVVTCQKGQQGRTWILQREIPQRLEILDATTSPGSPVKFCYFSQKLRLFPRPDHAGYRIRLQLSPRRLDPITDFNADHVWFIEAADLIFARAKYEIYKNILKDGAAAAVALADFHEQHQALQTETSRRHGSGRIAATLF